MNLTACSNNNRLNLSIQKKMNRTLWQLCKKQENTFNKLNNNLKTLNIQLL